MWRVEAGNRVSHPSVIIIVVNVFWSVRSTYVANAFFLGIILAASQGIKRLQACLRWGSTLTIFLDQLTATAAGVEEKEEEAVAG